MVYEEKWTALAAEVTKRGGDGEDFEKTDLAKFLAVVSEHSCKLCK